jgi:hypothetical protein
MTRSIGTRALVVALLGLALPGSAPARTTTLSWHGPIRIAEAVLTAVSCPSTHACVAVDLKGEIMATSAPGSGRARDWHVVRRPSGVALRSISCPSAQLCVAAGDHGDVVVSNRPNHTHSWTTLSASMYALTAVACPTTRLCVAVDDNGDVLTSTAPTRAGSWTSQHIDTGINYQCFHYGTTGPSCQSALQAISCAPSSAVCAATDDSGHEFASLNAGHGPWTNSGLAGSLPASQSFASISCPNTHLCVLVNGDGDVTQLDPSTSPQPNRYDTVDRSAGLDAIDCPSNRLCVTSDLRGRVWQSQNPTAQSPRWTTATFDHRGYVTALACRAATFCVAVDNSGHVLARGGDTPR